MEYLQSPLEVNPVSLLEKFNANMESNLPGWTPAPGNLDERIGGAGSQLIAQLNEAASDGATNFFRYFGANIANIPPHEATYATGEVTIVATDTLGHEIPSGTVFIWEKAGTRIAFETISKETIVGGTKETKMIAIRATEPGEESNGVEGKSVELQYPLSFIAEVELEHPTSSGLNEETDAAFLSRLREELQSFSPKQIIPKDFNILLLYSTHLESILVGRVYTKRGFNATGTIKEAKDAKTTSTSATLEKVSKANCEAIEVGTEVKALAGVIPAKTYVIEIKAAEEKVVMNNKAEKSGEEELTFVGLTKQGGYTTSWVTLSTGVALSEAHMKVLEKETQENMIANVEYRVAAPIYTKIKITATVACYPGQSETEMKERIKAAIEAYINPETWASGPTGQSKEFVNDPVVRYDTLYKILLDVKGTHYVSALKVNSAEANVILPGVVGLPELESATITVELK